MAMKISCLTWMGSGKCSGGRVNRGTCGMSGV
jgi:hypothetical protein